jgi:hypothetical protein
MVKCMSQVCGEVPRRASVAHPIGCAFSPDPVHDLGMSSGGLSLLERFKRFWRPAPPADYPLSEEERESAPPSSAIDEAQANLVDRLGADHYDDD